MNYTLYLIFLALAIQTSLFSQDLLVVNNDSVPCKIEKIDSDSSVYYKSKRDYDPYHGYLKKGHYSDIQMDFYTIRKRRNNPNGGLGYISAGVHYTQIRLNPMIDILFDDQSLLKNLSTGPFISISVQKFITKDPYENGVDRSGGNISMGMGFGHFSQSVNALQVRMVNDMGATSLELDFVDVDMQRNVNFISLNVSYNTKYNYTTYFALKPGLMFNNYSGYINSEPFQSKSTMVYMGFAINQQLSDVGERFSLSLIAEPYFMTNGKGKVEFYKLSYVSPILYRDTQIDYGLSAGLLLKFFY